MSNSSNQNENQDLTSSRNISRPPPISHRQLPRYNPTERSSRSSPTSSSTSSSTSSTSSPRSYTSSSTSSTSSPRSYTSSTSSSRSSPTSREPVRIRHSDFNLGAAYDAALLGSRMAMVGSPPSQPPSTTSQSKDPGIADLMRLTRASIRIHGGPNRTGRGGEIRTIDINRPLRIEGRVQPVRGRGRGQPVRGRGRGQPGGGIEEGRGQPGRGRGQPGRGRGQGTGEEKNNMV